MRLFGWVQNKLNGKQDNKRSNDNTPTSSRKHEAREEFNDWPQGLLSIGTFGNDDVKEIAKKSQVNEIEEDPSSCHDNEKDEREEEILDIITPEEVGKLQKELTKLLSRNKPNNNNNNNLPLDRFLNCPSSLEVDRRISNALARSDSEDYRDEDDIIDKTISIIIGKCKEAISAEKSRNKKSLGTKSISFLFKKMFVCQSGFVPAPSLRDSLRETRMEKFLRSMLQNKLSPQNSYRASKKFLEEKTSSKNKEDQEKSDQTSRDRITTDHVGSKWVKTDSEFIVLEI